MDAQSVGRSPRDGVARFALVSTSSAASRGKHTCYCKFVFKMSVLRCRDVTTRKQVGAKYQEQRRLHAYGKRWNEWVDALHLRELREARSTPVVRTDSEFQSTRTAMVSARPK